MLATALALAAATPTIIYTIDPAHRIVEGIASDGKTVWISSILDRTILACRSECRELVRLPDGPHPFALAWDERRELLWVAADCPPNVPGIVACERGSLLALDRRGRIRTRLTVPTGSFHPGDVTVAGKRIFVSDSQNGVVREVAKNGKTFVTLIPVGQGKSAQGTALSADGKSLLVADYSAGVSRFTFGASARSPLMRKDGKPLRGLDGLVRSGSAFYAIYNGAAPGALLRLTIADGKLDYQPVDTGTLIADPTQLVVTGKSLLVVADSGWATLDKEATRTKGATIIRVPLP